MATAQEDKDDERKYQQLRARLGLLATVDDELSAQVRLATGTSAISTNQTLGDPKEPGMARRNFGLDLAFMNWKFAEEQRLWAGRTANPFWSPGKSQLIFDADLSFEGLAYQFERKWTHSKIFLNLGSFVISENYDVTAGQDISDTSLVGAEIGFSESTDWGKASFHVGSFEYLNIQNKSITSIDKTATKIDEYSAPFSRYKGNIVYQPDATVAQYFFQDEFQLLETGIEWEVTLEDLKVLLFYDQVTNLKVKTLNQGSEYGISIRSGRSQFSLAQIEKQAEAVFSAFTDSDANGGGTDNKGTRFSASYFLSPHSQVTYTQFLANRGIDSVERKFAASQLDFSLSF
jgi:hypothetical protein